jgi:uracil-DNA glycosylase
MNTIYNIRTQLDESFSSIKSELMDTSIKDKIIKNGIGFFPYGSGLLGSDKENLPQGGLMILGQDFGDVDYITPELIQNGEANKPTFRKTTDLINAYPKEKVFMTNLFMGLRKEKGMIGDNPALKKKTKDMDYLNTSVKFFKLQLEYVNPIKIIVLGKAPYNFICNEFNGKSHKVVTFSAYISNQVPEKLLHINNIPVLCIPHPSMWNSNVKNQTEWKNIIKLFLK